MSSSTRARVAWLGCAAALGPVLVLLRTRSNGVNISPDSAAYLAAAEGIAWCSWPFSSASWGGG